MSGQVEAITKPMPRGWISLGLLCWGGFTEAWAAAIVMALMVEAIALSPVKWALTDREFHRAADLTSVIFALVTVVQFSRYSVHGIYQILVVAPYCFFPLLLAQQASTRRTIPMSALFYSLRKYPEHDRELDIAPHYIVICILAASTAAQRSSSFIIVTALIVVGLVLAARPRRYPWWQSLGAVLLAMVLTVATQFGVLRVQSALENSVMYWFNQFPWAPTDPNRAMTAIGMIGRLKLSDQIRVRVEPSAHVRLPLTLQEASYDVFKFGSWSAHTANFSALDKLADRDAWQSSDSHSSDLEPIEITLSHKRELTVLPVPRGTRQVRGKEIVELQRNRFGTLLAESPPGALRFSADAGDPISVEPPPTAADLEVPSAYREVINTTATEIDLPHDPAAAAAAIRQFFLDNFTYTLIQRGAYFTRTPLAHFLTETRRGHCEYFASAAVLLLRHAGIPARYAVGYVVEDYSELERSYIARARHAHAWALAYVAGEWITVDATPAVWYEMENDYASRWQGVQDIGAWLWYRYQRLGETDFSEFTDLLIYLVPFLAVILYFRLRKSPLAVHRESRRATAASGQEQSPFSALLDALEQGGLVPTRGETLARFLARAAPAQSDGVSLQALIQTYYAQRFSTRSLSADEEHGLRQEIHRYSRNLARRS